MMKRNHPSLYINAACIIAAALLFYFLNALTPYYADDYSYMRNFVTKEPISSIGDIVQSMGIHYMKVNGRIVVHSLAHLFLWGGKEVFNFINTAAFLTLGTLMYTLAKGGLKDFCVGQWLLGLFGVWLIAPDFGQSYLWVTGSANYLFGMLIVLAFLTSYTKPLSNERGRPWAIPLFFLWGAVSGWSNENTGAALLFSIMCLMARDILENKKISAPRLAGLIGCITGFCAMVFSPGESVRLDNAGGMGTIGLLLGRAVKITGKLTIYCWAPLLLIIIMAAVFLKITGKGGIRALFMPAVFTSAGLISAYAMSAAPYFPDRTWSGTVIFLMTAVLSMLNTLLKAKTDIPKTKLMKVLVPIALVCVFAATYINACSQLRPIKAAYDQRMLMAEEQLSSGKRDLSLPAISSQSRFSCFSPENDITSDSSYWLNVSISRYLGADTVTKKDD